MIRFSLRCGDGHEFEGWFGGSQQFESQRAAAQIACPLCGDTAVEKALMAPAISTGRAKEAVPLAANVPADAEMKETLRKFRAQLTQNAEYVGNRFAEEARRIHYDEVEKRGIYGEANKDEVRALLEEGIGFHPLPVCLKITIEGCSPEIPASGCATHRVECRTPTCMSGRP
jgi:hypothetical protein